MEALSVDWILCAACAEPCSDGGFAPPLWTVLCCWMPLAAVRLLRDVHCCWVALTSPRCSLPSGVSVRERSAVWSSLLSCDFWVALRLTSCRVDPLDPPDGRRFQVTAAAARPQDRQTTRPLDHWTQSKRRHAQAKQKDKNRARKDKQMQHKHTKQSKIPYPLWRKCHGRRKGGPRFFSCSQRHAWCRKEYVRSARARQEFRPCRSLSRRRRGQRRALSTRMSVCAVVTLCHQKSWPSESSSTVSTLSSRAVDATERHDSRDRRVAERGE